MNRLLIYILSLFIATSGTWVANKYQQRKVVKPLKKHIAHLQFDSTLQVNKIAKMAKDSTYRFKSDSLKSELIAQGQKVMQELSKINRQLKADTTDKAKEIASLKAWIEDAKDGVIIDTVEYKTNIFGKRKRIK